MTLSIDTLEKAFSLFSEESARLKEGYLSLQQEFKTLSDKLKLVIDHLEEGLIFLNTEGTCTLINGAACGFLEIEQQTLLGKPFTAFFDPHFFGFSLQEKQVHKEIHLELSNKKKLNVTARTIAQKGLLLVLRDVTEIEQLKNFLHHNETLKELGKMAAFLAHEIRNPLAAIGGFGSLLAQSAEGSSNKKMAENIVEASTRLGELVTRILAFSRPLSMQFQRIALETLIKEAASCYPCSFHSQGKPDEVLADVLLFKAALCNLIKNGYEASLKPVLLTLEREDNFLVIQVVDQGEGITSENLDLLFTPFFTTKKEGHGLGLSESYKIIQAHGGTLSVISKVGEGSTFTIKLPCL